MSVTDKIKKFFDVKVEVQVTVHAGSEDEAKRIAVEAAQVDFAFASAMAAIEVTSPERLSEYEQALAEESGDQVPGDDSAMNIVNAAQVAWEAAFLAREDADEIEVDGTEASK